MSRTYYNEYRLSCYPFKEDTTLFFPKHIIDHLSVCLVGNSNIAAHIYVNSIDISRNGVSMVLLYSFGAGTPALLGYLDNTNFTNKSSLTASVSIIYGELQEADYGNYFGRAELDTSSVFVMDEEYYHRYTAIKCGSTTQLLRPNLYLDFSGLLSGKLDGSAIIMHADTSSVSTELGSKTSTDTSYVTSINGLYGDALSLVFNIVDNPGSVIVFNRSANIEICVSVTSALLGCKRTYGWHGGRYTNISGSTAAAEIITYTGATV